MESKLKEIEKLLSKETKIIIDNIIPSYRENIKERWNKIFSIQNNDNIDNRIISLYEANKYIIDLSNLCNNIKIKREYHKKHSLIGIGYENKLDLFYYIGTQESINNTYFDLYNSINTGTTIAKREEYIDLEDYLFKLIKLNYL